MVNTLHSDEEKGSQDKESKEESILAMLGIIGTILNLLVIIFVYIYTTLWLLPTCRLTAAHLSPWEAHWKSLAWLVMDWNPASGIAWRRPLGVASDGWKRPETGLLSSAQVDSSRRRLRLWLEHVHDEGHLRSCSRHAKDCTESFFRRNDLLYRQRTCHTGILSAFLNLSLSMYIFVSDLKRHIQVMVVFILYFSVFLEKYRQDVLQFTKVYTGWHSCS